MFDKPAVPNPIETAEAHERFARGSKKGIVGVAALLALGGMAYVGWNVAYADDGRNQVHPGLKGLDLSPEEMERRVREAENGKNAGNYTVIAVKR